MLVRGRPDARIEGRGVLLDGGRIDALVVSRLGVCRTSAAKPRVGLAQLRRYCQLDLLDLVHVVFAPVEPRPLLLGLVRLRNRSSEPLLLTHTELWEVSEGSFGAAEGACERTGPSGVRALADVGSVVRARVPEPAPTRGLALDTPLVLPPDSIRELHFAYAAPPSGEPAAPLVRAWRGDVATELVRTVRFWSAQVGAGTDGVRAFREGARL